MTRLTFLFLACQPASAQEPKPPPEPDEFSFDTEEFEKSPWAIGGYLQGDTHFARLDRDGASYRISFLGKDQDASQSQGGAEVQARLTFQNGPFTAYALGTLQERHDGEEWHNDSSLYEGNLSWQAGSNAYFSLGKTLLRWGKGYAWNPTNFVGRSKNPSDPDLALEGYWLATVDIVKSFAGPLKTVALTGVILPVSDNINSDFAKDDHTNVAGKLYFLLHNTDIDLMALLEGRGIVRYGLTASTNIATNFEVHAEVAHVSGSQTSTVGPDGIATLDEGDSSSALAGIRYLTPTNTTLIFEYYYNGEGYTEDEAEDFFHFISVAEDSQLMTARPDLAGYQLPNFMRSYLYLKASQKEPFGWLYVTPALFTIVNLDDVSFSLIPEVSYTGVENLELRSRINILLGADATEYGDKVNNWKLELRVRYFF